MVITSSLTGEYTLQALFPFSHPFLVPIFLDRQPPLLFSKGPKLKSFSTSVSLLLSIHGGKTVPIVKQETSVRMEEGEHFAIETFGSTGRGYVQNTGVCSHYARKPNYDSSIPLRVSSARSLLYTINKEFGGLPFCRRYLDRVGLENYTLGLKHLVETGIVRDYPPLSDIEG